VGCESGLVWRHEALVAEMRLRGYTDRTPLSPHPRPVRWPRVFVTSPGDQFALLRQKYRDVESGRIPLPVNPQQLWAQHKYSVMARDPARYLTIGRQVARMKRGAAIGPLSLELVEILRQPPSARRLVNALEHMWGHVADAATAADRAAAASSAARLLETISGLAAREDNAYLWQSTALAELTIPASATPALPSLTGAPVGQATERTLMR
jgi:hypothetical protein